MKRIGASESVRSGQREEGFQEQVAKVSEWENIALRARKLMLEPDLEDLSVSEVRGGGSAGKESACNVGDPGSIPGSWRSPGEGKSYSLQYSGLENSMDCIAMESQRVGHDWATFTFQYSCLENPMHRGPWQARVHEVAKKSATTEWLNTHTHTHTHTHTARGTWTLSSRHHSTPEGLGAGNPHT